MMPEQLIVALDFESARALTNRIKAQAEDLFDLVVEAYHGQVWLALGYGSWDEYLTAELGSVRLKLPREERQEQVASLRERGLSLRAIASVTGTDEKTVRNDLGRAEYSAPSPTPVTGRDGKTYAPTRPRPGDFIEDEGGETHQVDRVDEGPDGESVCLTAENDDGERLVYVVPKPDLGDGVSHPARFHDRLIPIFAEVLDGAETVLDPFAGTGRIHELREHGYETTGVEIEPEWAELSEHTIVGDALDLPFEDLSFDAVCTSPTYGNRLADRHNASDPDRRRSYTHDLGRQLHEHNSGAMQWKGWDAGEYCDFHQSAYLEVWRVLRNLGLFVLNIKDHVRDGVVQPVSLWHVHACVEIGFTLQGIHRVPLPSLRQGANSTLRTAEEWVFVFMKEGP